MNGCAVGTSGRASAGAAALVLAVMTGLGGCGERPPASGREPTPGRTDATRASSPASAADPAAQSPLDSGHMNVAVVEFREAGGPGLVTVLPPDHAVEAAAEIIQRARLLASVGPLVFVERFVYANACGAHGSTVMDFLTLDLAGGQPVELLGASDKRDVVHAHRSEIVAAFRADSVATGQVPFTLDSLQLTEFRPFFSAARMGVEWQFTAEACYACSDDRWSGYSRSVRVSANRLPTALDTIAIIPDEVQAFFRGHPADSGGGWSRLDIATDRRDALARLFGVTAPAGSPEFLVWRRVDGGLTTAWLRGRGREATAVATAEGAWIAAGARAWRWTEREQAIKITSCDALGMQE